MQPNSLATLQSPVYSITHTYIDQKHRETHRYISMPFHRLIRSLCTLKIQGYLLLLNNTSTHIADLAQVPAAHDRQQLM